MAIDTLSFINGLMSLIFVIINTIIGLRIAITYMKVNRPIFLYMGFAWVGMGIPWWSSSVSFLFAVFTGSGLSFIPYVMIFLPLSPLIMILFSLALCELKYPRKKKIVFLIFVIIGIIIEVYLFYTVFTNPSEIGELHGIVDVEYKGIIRYWLIFDVIVVLIIGLLISHDSLVSDSPEVKLKGKFLLIAFILWGIGTIIDGFLEVSVPVLIFTRILLISSAIMFYFGFIPPGFIKHLFLKHTESST